MNRKSLLSLSLLLAAAATLTPVRLAAQWDPPQQMDVKFRLAAQGVGVVSTPVASTDYNGPAPVRVYMTVQVAQGKFSLPTNGEWRFKPGFDISLPVRNTWGTAPGAAKIEFKYPISGARGLGSTGPLEIHFSRPTVLSRNSSTAYGYTPDTAFVAKYVWNPDPNHPDYKGTLTGTTSFVSTVRSTPNFPSQAKIEFLDGKDFLDPKTKTITHDLDALRTQSGKEVKGFCADRKIQLLVRVTHISDPTPMQLEFTNFNSGLKPEYQPKIGTLTGVSVRQQVAAPMYFEIPTLRMYTLFKIVAPEEFFMPNSSMTHRTFQFAVYHTGGKKETTTLTLVRPPTVFAHGFNSSSDTWDGPFKDLANNQRSGFDAHAMNYDANAGFEANHHSVRDAIDQARALIRNKGYAVGRVNWVGHSMGGVLPRVHYLRRTLGADDWENADNYFGGEIKKMIILNSPQFGSPLATIVTWAKQDALGGLILRKIGRLPPKAVEDLSQESRYFVKSKRDPFGFSWLGTVGPTPIPTHAIVGLGVETVIANTTNGLASAAGMLRKMGHFKKLPYVAPAATAVRLLSLGAAYTAKTVYGQEEHDGVVTKSSQLAGFGETTGFATVNRDYSLPIPWTFHTHATEWQQVHDRVVVLLDSSVSGTFGWLAPPPAATPVAKPPLGLVPDKFKISLTIVGRTVQIQFVSQGFPESIDDYHVFDTFGSDISSNSQSNIASTIPQDWVGCFGVFVVARGRSGALYVSNVAQHSVTAAITNMDVQHDRITLPEPGATDQIRIEVTLANGRKLPLVCSAYPGITFLSKDPTIASLAPDGTVTSIGRGRAEIEVRFQTITRQVTVESKWANPTPYGTPNHQAGLDLFGAPPRLNSTAVFLTQGIPAQATGLLGIGVSHQRLQLPIPLYIQGIAAIIPQRAGPAFAMLPIPVPNDPALVDLPLFAQSFFTDAAAPAGVSASNGLFFTVVK